MNRWKDKTIRGHKKHIYEKFKGLYYGRIETAIGWIPTAWDEDELYEWLAYKHLSDY